jgi:hypothetical protein
MGAGADVTRSMGAPSYAEIEDQANRMAGTLVACTTRIEELQVALRTLLDECCDAERFGRPCENVCHIQAREALGRAKK